MVVHHEHPDGGDVIPGSGGCRKVRWVRPGIGKPGGVRVIYFQQTDAGRIWLLLIYAKGVRDTIAPNVLKEIRETIEGV